LYHGKRCITEKTLHHGKTIFLKSLFKYFNFDRSFVFRLTGCLHSAIFADAIEAPYLRITPGHHANIGEKDTLFKDPEPPKTIPYSAARTYTALMGEYPPRGFSTYVNFAS